MKKLIKAIPEAVSIASGMINNKPILTVCGALCLWSKLRNVATITVSKEQAFVRKNVILTMKFHFIRGLPPRMIY